ncbi:MAG: helix-turn-helix domain-containing protein, partial [Oceanicaulis sp.]
MVSELNVGDETEHLEAKRGQEAGKSLYETVCALSNEPELGGGTILLGVEREQALFPQYEVVGIEDPDKLSSDIASGCASKFNQVV